MALGRSYLYLISRSRTAFGKRYVWWVKDALDLGRMEVAAEIFRGFHDFSSFADKRIDKHLSTEVKIDRTEVVASGELIIFRIVGSHFLWKMVRRLAGILVEAGRGEPLPGRGGADADQRLGNSRTMHGAPSGLFLAQVLYEGDHLGPLSLPSLPLLLQRGLG